MWRRLRDTMAEHLREQFSLYLVVGIIFTAGVAAGALSVRMLGEGQISELNEFFFGFIDFLVEQPIDQSLILRRALVQNAKFIGALFVCGTFFIGFVPVLLLLFYRGFAIGFAVGFLAEQNSLRGVLFAAGAILPQNIIYVPVAIISGVCAIIFSLLLFKRRMSKKAFPFGSYLMQYSLLMLIAAALFAVGSLVEAVITPVFMKAVVSVM